MKKKVLVATLIVTVMTVLFVLSKNPIISSDIEISETHMEAIKGQVKGFYFQKLPLIPVYVSIDRYVGDVVYYTIHYFPFGTVGMSYIEGDGYNIEKALTNM